MARVARSRSRLAVFASVFAFFSGRVFGLGLGGGWIGRVSWHRDSRRSARSWIELQIRDRWYPGKEILPDTREDRLIGASGRQLDPDLANGDCDRRSDFQQFCTDRIAAGRF